MNRKSVTRFFITEYPKGTGETGWRAGKDDGYKDENKAVSAAEQLTEMTGYIHSVDKYDVGEDGERFHVETVCFCHPTMTRQSTQN